MPLPNYRTLPPCSARASSQTLFFFVPCHFPVHRLSLSIALTFLFKLHWPDPNWDRMRTFNSRSCNLDPGVWPGTMPLGGEDPIHLTYIKNAVIPSPPKKKFVF